MNCYDFSFQKSYTGFWNIEGIDKSIAGTLFLYENSIEIDLYCEGSNIRIDNAKPIYGKAFANNLKGNEQVFLFILNGFYIRKTTSLSKGMYHIILDVESFYIYQKEGFNTDKILSACINTPILDNWVSTLIRNRYKYSNSEKGHIKIEYVSPEILTLHKDPITNFCVYIYFGWQQAFKGNDVSIRPRSFLNIDFEKEVNIHEAHRLIETTKFFFFLIWNNSFLPTFTEFRTPKGNFILKLSNKHSYQFHENLNNATSYTDIEDFDDKYESSSKEISYAFSTQQLENALSKWFALYDNHTDALDTYFDTISNKYIMPSIKIKNFISTIDALSENLIDYNSIEKKRKEKRESIEQIILKTESILNKSEIKQLRNSIGILDEKKKKQQIPLNKRFLKLLDAIKEFLPDDIDEDFVVKIVNTRNNITHPKEKKEPAFSSEEYDGTTYLLTKVIRAYLLKVLGISPYIIKKITEF